MNLRSKTLLAVTVAISAIAAVATLVGIVSQVDRFSLTRWDSAGWDSDVFPWPVWPYLVLVVLAIIFRKTVSGCTISLIGALMIGSCGVFRTYTAANAKDIGFTPLVLFAGCVVMLLAQLVCWGVMWCAHRQA
jgi:hypothetical protein